MSIQSDTVKRKITPVGAAKCDICKAYRADCIQWKTGWFWSAVVCDTCVAFMMREFDPDKRGDAK